MRTLFHVLRWSRYWAIFLTITCMLWLAPLTLSRIASTQGAALRNAIEAPPLVACAFALAGLISLFSGPMNPYYLLCFTPWAVLAILTTARVYPTSPMSFRNLLLALLLIAWIPSLLWNAMRLRESLFYRQQIDHRVMAKVLADHVPATADLRGDPLAFIVAEEAGLRFTPAPWFAEHASVPPTAWLFLSEQEFGDPKYILRADVQSRNVSWRGEGFPGAGPLGFRFVILAPTADEWRSFKSASAAELQRR